MEPYEIKDGEGYYSVHDAYVTIENKNNDEDFPFQGYAEVLLIEMYWDNSAGELSAQHAEQEVFSEGYGFNGKVYDSEEDFEKDGFKLIPDEDFREERHIWNFETLEEAEKFALETLKKKAEEYSFDSFD